MPIVFEYRANTRPGSANPQSFEGPFHTYQGSFWVISAGIYKGDVDPFTGGYWVGETFGLGKGPAGFQYINWEYQKMHAISYDDIYGAKYGECMCLLEILSMAIKNGPFPDNKIIPLSH